MKYTVLIYSILGVIITLVIVLFAVYFSTNSQETVQNNQTTTKQTIDLNKEEEYLDSVNLDTLGEDDLRQLELNASSF